VGHEGVAHYDPRTGTFAENLTLNDLNRAIDSVIALRRRYMLLIQRVDVLPIAIMSPWAQVFRVPWVPDDQSLRRIHQASAERDTSRSG
jgi:hypothetical protein